MSKFQRMMHWWIIIKDSESNIHHIDLADNTLAGTLTILSSAPNKQFYTSTRRDQIHVN